MQTFINNSVEQKKETKGEWLHQLPSELVGILPQNVWVSLSLEQKKDVLRQHNLLDKYNAMANEAVDAANDMSEVSSEDLSNGVESKADIEATKTQVPEVLTVDRGMVDEKEAFSRNVEALKSKEQQSKIEPVLSGEDKARVNQEQAVNANKKTAAKVSVGYGLKDDVVTNAVAISQNGNTDDGRVWAAALVRKIFAIFD